jgi:hypothetical protein
MHAAGEAILLRLSHTNRRWNLSTRAAWEYKILFYFTPVSSASSLTLLLSLQLAMSSRIPNIHPGRYVIRFRNGLVGRLRNEPFDLSPKQVFVNTDDTQSIWVIQPFISAPPTPTPGYILLNKGDPAAIVDGQRVACLPQGRGQPWELITVPGIEGRNFVYV